MLCCGHGIAHPLYQTFNFIFFPCIGLLICCMVSFYRYLDYNSKEKKNKDMYLKIFSLYVG